MKSCHTGCTDGYRYLTPGLFEAVSHQVRRASKKLCDDQETVTRK